MSQVKTIEQSKYSY